MSDQTFASYLNYVIAIVFIPVTKWHYQSPTTESTFFRSEKISR
jgi:hypothetical protein